ncbi:hypothetical protein AD933_00515 [Acetobacter malorum]|uniref:Uncharacterized protein n=1 Tax=Acetobacter malorum TaxID=178901 RepID=A0A149S6P5_9PROT|nr:MULTISPECIES: hypothetical protein [Acetobacter]KXV22389.1 hypothetical protein AD933_00515 [Acetobacter malorum]MBS0963375.1 hypothetical protein [Acetobacter persici]
MAQNNWGHPKNQALIAEIAAADISVLKGRRRKIREILALTELTSIDKETLLALLEAERLRADARESAARAAKVEKRFDDRARAQRAHKLVLLGTTVRAAKLPEGNRERLLAALLMVKERLAGTDPKNPFPNISESYLEHAREIIAKEKKKRQS